MARRLLLFDIDHDVYLFGRTKSDVNTTYLVDLNEWDVCALNNTKAYTHQTLKRILDSAEENILNISVSYTDKLILKKLLIFVLMLMPLCLEHCKYNWIFFTGDFTVSQ